MRTGLPPGAPEAKEGSVLPCDTIRCAFFKAHHCHESGVDGSGGSVEKAERDKEMQPELSHPNGGKAVSNMGRGRGRHQTASGCLKVGFYFGVLNLRCLWTPDVLEVGGYVSPML